MARSRIEQLIYPVQERHERVLIVGSGPSAGQVDWASTKFPSNVIIIAVKEAIDHIPQATHWMTIDGNDKSRRLLTNKREGVRYYAGVSERFLGPYEGIHFLRRISGVAPRGGRFGLAEDRDSIHAGNSGYAALGLAYHMNAKRIVLLGIDAIGGYFFDKNDGPNNLTSLPALFKSAVEQLNHRHIEVVNASELSKIDCFPKMPVAAALNWLAEGLNP